MTNQGESVVDGAVMVRGFASGFAQVVEVRSHRFAADEPTSVGGTDRGPTHMTCSWRRWAHVRR